MSKCQMRSFKVKTKNANNCSLSLFSKKITKFSKFKFLMVLATFRLKF